MAAPESHEAYIRQALDDPGDALLRDLARDAAARRIPVLGPAAARFVAALYRSKGPADALDLGTATGYSAIWLGRVARETGGRVVGVERDAARVEEARAHVAKAGLDGVVSVLHGEALDFLQAEGDAFDLILLDIDKAQYAAAEPRAVERLRPGGMLVADNATFPEVREYNALALSDERLETTLVHGFWPGHSPEHDALALSVKRHSGAGARGAPLG